MPGAVNDLRPAACPCSKALVTSSGGAVLGDTGPHPVAEDCPVDVSFQPVAQRSLAERVRALNRQNPTVLHVLEFRGPLHTKLA
jgi:hypothetical protein